MISAIFNSIIDTFQQASLYILIGLTLSGIIQAFIDKNIITRWMGGRSFKSVLMAAIAGVPLPLCSCGVIPMAISLRQQGASRGAVVSFLIATPETGLDSILLSFALLNPFMAIFRPIAAFITALVAGIIENVFDRRESMIEAPLVQECCTDHETQKAQTFAQRLKNGLSHAFGQLLDDLTPWLIIGLVSAGIISYLVPASFIERFLGGGIGSMLVMLAIGLPLYICASASTPIAAALILKGMSPGTALVFLLAGPASNTATMITVYKFLGKRALVIYLATISACSIGFGLLLDAWCVYGGINMKVLMTQQHEHMVNPAIEQLGAMVLLLLMAYGLYRRYLWD